MKLFTSRAVCLALAAFAPCLGLFTGELNAQTGMGKTSPASHDYAGTKSKLPENVSESWFDQAAQYVNRFEHSFHPETAYGVFTSANAEQRLSMQLNASGYTIKNLRASEKDQTWKTSFSIRGAGRQQISWVPGADYSVTNNITTVVYQYPAMDVEYINSADGIRQNFIVKEKFAGEGNLSVSLELQTDLEARLADGQKLALYTKGANSVLAMSYEDLKVWDANNKPLASHMELDNNGSSLSLVVDDKNAVYPVTIDPLNRVPTWLTSSDDLIPTLLNNLALQVNTLYGHVVAGLGDVNGDGFDDVAVGAPGMIDIVVSSGLANVGAVFVYFGSPTGLPTVPSKVLVPTTPLAGALFGFSVAGGDVTGDGINDIIVGAPLDNINLNFGAGGVNGQVGKVYVFEGGALTGPNPTSLVSVTLNTAAIDASTITLKALYGFSVAAVDDMNGDGKGEIVVGAPTYVELSPSHIATGGAFVHLSDPTNSFTTIRSLQPQNGGLLGIGSAVQTLIQDLPIVGPTLWATLGGLLTPVLNGPVGGLLFGFSVSGAGPYNNDAFNDIVVGAPAGVNLGNLTSGLSLGGVVSGLLGGQFLGGSAFIFSGLGNATGVTTTSTARLQAASSGLLSNAANLFGYTVLGAKNISKQRDGRLIIGAPMGSLVTNLISGFSVNAGAIHVFKKKTVAPVTPVVSDQAISSARANGIAGLLTSATNLTVMYGSSIDNLYDINCDGIGDLIVGEPMSSAVGLLSANAVGGAAYAYLGRADGTYNTTPVWDATTTVSPLLGINATALLGHSVAGAGNIAGMGQRVGLLVGGPSNSLDFGAGLLNLGNTMAVLNSFAWDNNGLGKAYNFDPAICNPIILATTITEFSGREIPKAIELTWKTKGEENIKCYEVMKSADGIHFTRIGIVYPKSNALGNTYTFEDKNPSGGTNYYRLTIRNKDGKTNLSQILNFKYGEVIIGSVLVAPNPVKQMIRVRFAGMEKGTYRLEVRNTTGQLFKTKQVAIGQAEQVEYIDRTNNMNTGIYWLTVYDETNSRVKTVRMLVE